MTKREELVKIEESRQNFLFYLTKKRMKEVFTQSASEIQEIAWVVDNVKSELQELKKGIAELIKEVEKEFTIQAQKLREFHGHH